MKNKLKIIASIIGTIILFNNINIISEFAFVKATSDNVCAGDVNNDGSINTLDIIELVEYIVYNSNSISIRNSDINNDSSVNSADLVKLFDIFLQSEIPYTSDVALETASKKYTDIVFTRKYCYTKYNPSDESTTYVYYNNGDGYIYIENKQSGLGSFFVDNASYLHFDKTCCYNDEIDGVLEGYDFSYCTEYVKSGNDYMLNGGEYHYDEYCDASGNLYIKYITDVNNSLLAIVANDNPFFIGDIVPITEESSNNFYSFFNSCNIFYDFDEFGEVYAEYWANGLVDYVNALFETCVYSQTPDGSYSYFDKSDDSFAIIDIDKDRKNELIYRHVSDVSASHMDIVYKINDYGNIVAQNVFQPYSEYYSNGIVKEYSSIGQGYSGRFSPFCIWKYNSAIDKYECVGGVDAWDRTVATSMIDYYTQETKYYPDYIDTEKSGFVYFIDYPGYNVQTPVSQSEYELWISTLIDEKYSIKTLNFSPLKIDYIYNAKPHEPLISSKPDFFKLLGM